MHDPMMRDGYTAAAPSDMATEMLTGATVYDANDEAIGEVSQLNIDSAGKITEAIVDIGGFLGMGEKPVALKLSDLDILREDGGDDLRVYVGMTKEQMEALPTYSK
jgi:sporulation protein YlmC with PRC-barrel domain